MSTASDYEVEQTVQATANPKRKGVVIGNKLSDGDQVVAIEWADGTLAKVNANDIQPSMSIEEEFELFKSQVNEKLQQAADLIREANALAGAQGKDLQAYDSEAEDAMFDSHLLERAMRDSGWNTSSWHC